MSLQPSSPFTPDATAPSADGDRAAAAPGLQLRLLGTPAWRLGEGAWQALAALDAALAAMLALEGPCARDTLAGRLWPGASRQGAPNNLRQHVSRLLRQMGVPLFVTGAVYRLCEGVRLDLGPAAALPATDDDEFLAGCDFGHSDWLQEWVAAQRQALRTERALQLARRAETLEQADDLAGALSLAWRVTALRPLHETAWRQVMRLHYLQGDHTAAVEAFEHFEALLREQTGARPGPETLHLLSTVEQAGVADLPHRRLPASLQRPPRRIGREAVWRAMSEAWAAGRPFLLWGEAGMGKSRLLEDFAAERSGMVAERARPGDALASYSLLARTLRAVLQACRVAPEGAHRRELARLLPELGPAPGVPGDEGRLRAAVEAVLVQALDAPPPGMPLGALVLDDLQFADLATLEMLRWLGAGRSLHRLRLGMAARPPADSAVRALFDGWLVDSLRPVPLALAPLSAPEVDELLATLRLPGFGDRALGARLVAHTGGHPLFVLETLKEAWLHEADPAGGALPRPASVQVLIEGRLRELSPEAGELVRVAAIAGEDFDAGRAAALLGRNPLALAPAWSALERAQILQGSRFVHDLMHECALALVPPALAQVLHATLAGLLETDARAAAARVAAHWQAAERHAEAGQWWQRAAQAARLAGRLQEQQTLLERAAAAHRQAGASQAEFDCVRDSLHAGMLRHGGESLLAGLPRLQALAVDRRQQLDVLLLQTEALQGLDRFAESLALAQQAEPIAAAAGLRLADALGLQGVALAHLGRAAQAVTVLGRAVAAATEPPQRLRALRTQAYALYALSRLGEALPVQREVLRLAVELGDETEAATAEVSLAALLAPVGDVAGSHAHAQRAATRLAAMGLAQDSALAESNLITLGMAAAALGRLDEAVQALSEAVRLAGPGSAPSAQAKARTALARVRLWLGEPAAALDLVQHLPGGVAVGQRMQAALIVAQAERMAGRSGEAALSRLARLGSEHPDLPPMLSAWLEWSYQGEPAAAIARLRSEHSPLQALGLPGAARALQLREVDRLGELDDADAVASAAVLAAELLPHVAGGLHAKVYPPEAWWVLRRAFERAGRAADAAQCTARALAWLDAATLPGPAEAARARFLDGHPANRALRQLTSSENPAGSR